MQDHSLSPRGLPRGEQHNSRRPSRRSRTIAVAAVIALAALPAAVLAQRSSTRAEQRAAEQRSAGIELAPHRAVYAFTLGTTRASNSVASLSGRMVYEFTGSTCDGYSQAMRFVTRTTSQEGEAVVSDQRTTSWEDVEGLNYRFQSSQYRGDALTEQTAGIARRGEGDGDIRVELSHP